MSVTLEIKGLTTIPIELLDVFRENCQIEQMTVNCLKIQLNNQYDIPLEWPIIVNSKIQRDLEAIIYETDLVQILPLIAGGNEDR